MKVLLCVLGFVTCAVAQPTGQPFTCVGNTGTPVITRVEGITELVGDLLLKCTGGANTPLGQIVPAANIRLTLNTSLTSRLLSDGGSEALMLIDEPHSPSNPNAPIKACLNFVTGCLVQGTGKPLNYGIDAPNTYRARQVSVSAVEWDGVPIDAPSTTGVRVYRITNVRANVAQLGVNPTPIPSQVIGSISINGVPVVINGNPQVLATVQPSVSFAYQAPTLTQSGTSPIIGSGGGPAVINVRFGEIVPGAWKKKDPAASASNPFATSVTDVPGQPQTTESGFQPAPSVGFPSDVGSADLPTALHLSIMLDKGCQVRVPGVNSLTSTSVAAAGTAVTFANGAVASGTDDIIPAAADGSVEVLFLLAEVINTAGATKALNVPVTLNCSLSGLPRVIAGIGNYAPVFYSPSTLFVPASANAPLLPAFSAALGIDTGIAVGNNQREPLAFVRDAAANPAPAFNFYSNGNLQPTFQGLINGGSSGPATSPEASSGPALVAPSQFDFGVTAPGAPISGVTVAKDPSATWLTVTLNQNSTPVTASVKVDPTLAAGNYSANLTFTSPNAPGVSLVVPVTYKVQALPFFTRWGFANSGSYVNNVVAPGEPFVIFGGNFGPPVLAGPTFVDNHFTTTVGNTQVLFDGQPAPLYYSVNSNGAAQVAGFAPFALDGKLTTLVQVSYNGTLSPAVTIPVTDAVPAMFTSDQSGGGEGAILNQNLSVNGAGNPESPGNVIVLYGGGAGQTTPPGRDGAAGGLGGTLGVFKLPVKVFIDGVLATDVPYIGQAPGLVEGVFQINVRIPASARHPANLPVLVQIGDKMIQPGVTVAVK